MPAKYDTGKPAEKVKGPASFWGMYAGEHTAGTELMIGPLFIASGVSAVDVVGGLFVGNLLAVLATLYPALRASRIGPAEALRYE